MGRRNGPSLLALPMTRKQQRLQEKPIKLLCFVPSPEQKPAANPFEPSAMRVAMRKVAVALEDWTERFETWCDRRTQCEPQPLSLTHRVQRLLGWSGAETTSVAVREPSTVHARGWESAVGEVIFRVRDRAGHVQRALLAQARELKEWMVQHSQETQAELENLRAQVVTQERQLETMNNQLQDLRALVSSQQQVLVYMGKELDSGHGPAADVPSAPSRRPANRSKKAPKAKRRVPAETGQAPYLNA
jgi:uncharacterized coiled-coil protein SlyX